jgi:hypothetical protein
LVPPCARDAGLRMVRHLGERQKTMTAPRPRTRQPKQLDAGILQAEIRSFRLRLAAEGKAAKTIRTYTDLWQWEITVHGKGGKDRIVRIGRQAARSLDRYLRSRSRHPPAHQPQLWLGAGNREPLTAADYQMIARRGRQCGVDAYPHRFRRHFSHTWLDRGGPEGDLMETQRPGLPADAHPLRRQRPQRPRPPHLRPHHDRHLMPRLCQPPGSPTKIPQARVPGGPHRYPTDMTAFRGTPRHSC